MGVAGHIAVCWPNGYINFAINSGGASGATGWGFRDNAGIVEAKHSGGAWAPVGDVTGPAAAVADRIAVFNGATGKLIKDGGITIAGLSAYVPSGNIAANTLAGAIAELDAEKVAKAGDTMTGHLTLPAGPAAANATRKDYVDAAAALKLAKAGDTMTGDLQFNAGFATTGITPASNPGLGNTTFGFNMRQDGYGPIIFYNRNNYGGIYIGQNIDGTLLSWTRSGATVGAIGVTTTSTSYGTSSDERLKEDLKSFNAGNIIDDTNVYNFAWKATGERSYGIIAQQANEIYPTAIIHDEEQDWWGVDYSKYVPVILQELKALRARVAELEMAAGIKPPTIDPKVKSAPKKKTKKVKKAKSKRGIRHG
jgi:hypothetical protein